MAGLLSGYSSTIADETRKRYAEKLELVDLVRCPPTWRLATVAKEVEPLIDFVRLPRRVGPGTVKNRPKSSFPLEERLRRLRLPAELSGSFRQMPSGCARIAKKMGKDAARTLE